MSDKTDGGWAFPMADTDKTYGTNGMSLRDYFAAMVMQGVLAGDMPFKNNNHLAEIAYAAADAMLRERARATEGDK